MTVTLKHIDFSEFDLIIIGGGCAGLSLSLALLHFGYKGKVLVVERRKQYQHDRTWSGWFSQTDLALLPNLSKRTFASWSIANDSSQYSHTSNAFPYYSISSEDFYTHALQKINASQTVQLVTGTSLSSHDLMAMTQSRVIDTVGLGIEVTRPRYGLWQSFVGVMVSSSSPIFDMKTQSHAMLMADMSQDDKGFFFTYIIPQNSRQALVEVTYFSTQVLAADYLTECSTQAAHRFIQHQQAFSDHQIMTMPIEHGHLPMWEISKQSTHDHITLAGNISGALRSSSGYGFATIQRWAQETAQTLSSSEPLPGTPLVKPRYYSRWIQWMDNIFLIVLVRYPAQSQTIFLQMAKALKGDEFALFMSHRASLSIWVKVIMAMPKWPFIKAVWRSWLD